MLLQITIINGPNLNLLGYREPHLYGDLSFPTYLLHLKERFSQVQITYQQSNIEGELVNFIQAASKADGVILNAAAYSHTSLAIADAVAAISTPVIEVHISNIQAREEIRRHSLLTAYCKGIISGLGLEGYALALSYFLNKTRHDNPSKS